jgi:nucleotide-binding universal stress UspA family protein
VLVGLGDGAEADRALRVAAEEALRRARPLHVLRSYEHLATVHGCDAVGAAWDEVQEHLARARLDAGLHVTVILTPDPPASALLQHGGLADLVVVGSRGSLALARLATGSVSRALLDAATWPLLVVPAA